MWILKTSKDLVESLSYKSLSVITSIKTFGFSTLYTTIPHSKLTSRLKDLVTNSFLFKSGKQRYSYIVVHGFNGYFVKDCTTFKTKYTEDDIVNMINWMAQCQFKVTEWGIKFICGTVLRCVDTLEPGLKLDQLQHI